MPPSPATAPAVVARPLGPVDPYEAPVSQVHLLSLQAAVTALSPPLPLQQIAAVVNYVRTHFGNDYGDAVTAADVRAARGK